MQTKFVRIDAGESPRPAVVEEPTPRSEPPTAPAPTAPTSSPVARETQRSSRHIPVGLVGDFGLGGVRDHAHDGGRVTLGGALRIGPVLIEANPLDSAISPGNTYPYYQDTFSNNQSRCRNSLNGQFASDSNYVAYDVSYFKSVAAGVEVPRSPVYVGMGRRFDGVNNPWFGSGGVMGVFGGRSQHFPQEHRPSVAREGERPSPCRVGGRPNVACRPRAIWPRAAPSETPRGRSRGHSPLADEHVVRRLRRARQGRTRPV